MARTPKRSEQDIARLLKGYNESGLTRRQYCSQQGIPVTTFDYYRHRREHQKPPHTSTSLVKVDLIDANATKPCAFTIALAKGRSIKGNHWNFADADLTRLIRIVETA
jgi:hypothetical protein